MLDKKICNKNNFGYFWVGILEFFVLELIFLFIGGRVNENFW